VPLVTSLLTAIVRADGDALVLHAGERPYVVTPTGQSELASRALTLEAVKGMLNELLSPQAKASLAELGAVQHDLPSPGFASGETFTVVAARGGDDIWIEIRRHRKPVYVAPEPEPEPEPIAVVAPEPAPEPIVAREPEPKREPERELGPEPAYTPIDLNLEIDTPAIPAPERGARNSGPMIEQIEDIEQETYDIGIAADVHEISLDMDFAGPQKQEPAYVPEPLPAPPARPAPAPPPQLVAPPEPETRHAVVLPLSRNQVRGDQSARFTPSLHASGIDRLFRIAAARGASTLYLTSQARPSIRVDGEISPIEGESTLTEGEVETLILDMIPERNREALRSQAGTEWICDVPDVGRIRCVTFRDHRGAGGIFQMIPARAISAEQLGLSREIQGLCAEADGLVLVAGPRSSGKSTLISAFVDLINRTRSEYVITIENQIKFVHENRGALVSQREVRGDHDELLSVARAALRENPDVLVVEDFGSPEIVTLALEAAQSGHLVIGSLTAHTATDAVDRIIDQTPPERRPKVQLGLAENLRGIVAQALLRKTGGGRVAAREVLLNTSAVANLIAEGKTSQLPMAIDSGRKHGMVALNDALVAFVQGGIVDSREAYRQAADQQGFLALLKRQGIDTSFVERLA
jgi:twitching motility protein PilT